MNQPLSIATYALAASGDEQAFATLFQHHKDRVYSIALRYTTSVVISEEVVQDVFVRVWKNREKLTQLDNPAAWIYTIARNCSLTALKQIAIEGRRKEELLHWKPPQVGTGAGHLEEHELQVLLNTAISRLTPQQKKVFELSRIQGLKRDVIAAEMGLSAATVSVHLTIAIRQVRAFLLCRLDYVVLLICAGGIIGK